MSIFNEISDNEYIIFLFFSESKKTVILNYRCESSLQASRQFERDKWAKIKKITSRIINNIAERRTWQSWENETQAAAAAARLLGE